MSQADPFVYRRRRLYALIALITVVSLAFALPQLFADQNQQPQTVVTEAETTEPASTEVANCQPGVVEVEAFIGRATNHESLTNIPQGEQVFIWYEVVNTGLVDCIFDVGSYATFYTISSGDQVYYSSRDCDRSNDRKLPQTLKANQPIKSVPGEWLKVYSSPESQCGPENRLAPTGGAAYDIKVEVSGVVSDKKRFFLF